MLLRFRFFVPSVACLLLLSASPIASADQQMPSKFTAIAAGVNGGVSWGQNTGPLVGGDVSVVHWRHLFWFGGYGDILYDGNNKTGRFSVGGEAGVGPVGVDAGYVRDFDPGRNGWRVRGLLSAPMPMTGVSFEKMPVYFTLYGGGGRLYDNNTHEAFYDVGLLIKYAFGL